MVKGVYSTEAGPILLPAQTGDGVQVGNLFGFGFIPHASPGSPVIHPQPVRHNRKSGPLLSRRCHYDQLSARLPTCQNCQTQSTARWGCRTPRWTPSPWGRGCSQMSAERGRLCCRPQPSYRSRPPWCCLYPRPERTGGMGVSTAPPESQTRHSLSSTLPVSSQIWAPRRQIHKKSKRLIMGHKCTGWTGAERTPALVRV